MAKERKVAFFDFCETIVNFQTANAFIDYVRKYDGTFYMKLLNFFYILLSKLRVFAIANKIIPSNSYSKKIKLLQLKGFTYERLDNLAESYYAEKLSTSLISPVMKEMENLGNQGFEICIVSAGYSIYLKYFALHHGIKHIIGTELDFKEGKNICRGRIRGKDCINDEKPFRIKSYFEKEKVDYLNSIAFSDSISDLPMLKMVGNGVVISKDVSRQWSIKHQLREIIWTYDNN